MLRDCFKCKAKESVPFKKITTGEHESVTVYKCRNCRHHYCLEYVLTWRYSDNPEADEKRYMELSSQSWNYREYKKKLLNK